MNDRHIYNPCEDREFDIADLVDGTLASERIAAVQRHLLVCPRCSAWHAALQAMDAGLAAAVGRPGLSPEFGTKLQARIEGLTTARRLAADAARTEAESEYERMLATLQGWRWRAVLNGVATAAVVGGALLGLQALLPPLSGTLDLQGVPDLRALAVGAGVAFGAVMTLRARRFGFGGVPTLWG